MQYFTPKVVSLRPCALCPGWYVAPSLCSAGVRDAEMLMVFGHSCGQLHASGFLSRLYSRNFPHNASTDDAGAATASLVAAVTFTMLLLGQLDQGAHQHSQCVVLLHLAAGLAHILQHIWQQHCPNSTGT
jgi:hypothetical protein